MRLAILDRGEPQLPTEGGVELRIVLKIRYPRKGKEIQQVGKRTFSSQTSGLGGFLSFDNRGGKRGPRVNRGRDKGEKC